MKFTTFFTAGLSTVLASSTSVLLPLYVYPSPGVWNPVFDAITAHPNVLFYVVVNPDSGPGASGASTLVFLAPQLGCVISLV